MLQQFIARLGYVSAGGRLRHRIVGVHRCDGRGAFNHRNIRVLITAVKFSIMRLNCQFHLPQIVRA